jgi:hypothetical protein
VLDSDLRVVTASRSFYLTFQVNRQKTQGQLLYDFGGRSLSPWSSPMPPASVPNFARKHVRAVGPCNPLSRRRSACGHLP